MATAETLFHQIAGVGLDLSSLLSLRDAIRRRIPEAKRDLEDHLRLLDGAAVVESRLRRVRSKRGADARPRAVYPAGRNEGLTAAEAVRKASAAGGGWLSLSRTKKAFDEAGDLRPINLIILVLSGRLKAVGNERRQHGKRGRVGTVSWAGHIERSTP